jgi:hypothetical protein
MVAMVVTPWIFGLANESQRAVTAVLAHLVCSAEGSRAVHSSTTMHQRRNPSRPSL